jgi:hypothetical protein
MSLFSPTTVHTAGLTATGNEGDLIKWSINKIQHENIKTMEIGHEEK